VEPESPCPPDPARREPLRNTAHTADATSRRRALLAGAALLAVAAGAAMLRGNRGGASPYADETAKEREAGIRDAFAGPREPVPLTSPEAIRIDALFARMVDATRRQDPSAVAACFDAVAMVELIAAQHGSPESKRAVRAGRREPERLEQAFAKGMGAMLPHFGSQSHTLRRLEIDAAGKKAMAWVVFRDSDGALAKQRFWLVRNGDWRACDFEDIDMGLRATTAAALAAGTAESAAANQRALSKLHRLVAALESGDAPEGRRLLDAIRSEIRGPALIRIVDFLEIVTLLQEGRSAEALQEADVMAAHVADMPILHCMRLTALAALQRHAEAIEAGERYLGYLGDDPDVLVQMAECHLALEHADRARDCALRALRESPASEEALILFGRTAAPGDESKLETYLGMSADAEECLEEIAFELGDAEVPACDVLTAVAERVASSSSVTALLTRRKRARALWKAATSAGAVDEEVLVAALREGSPEEAEALCEELRVRRTAAGDADGLEGLAAAGEKARPASVESARARAAAHAVRLRPALEAAPDPGQAIRDALRGSAHPGWLAWELTGAWEASAEPELAHAGWEALQAVAPDDPMVARIADYLGIDLPRSEPPHEGGD